MGVLGMTRNLETREPREPRRRDEMNNDNPVFPLSFRLCWRASGRSGRKVSAQQASRGAELHRLSSDRHSR